MGQVILVDYFVRLLSSVVGLAGTEVTSELESLTLGVVGKMSS
jgi:hypothetical protein